MSKNRHMSNKKNKQKAIATLYLDNFPSTQQDLTFHLGKLLNGVRNKVEVFHQDNVFVLKVFTQEAKQKLLNLNGENFKGNILSVTSQSPQNNQVTIESILNDLISSNYDGTNEIINFNDLQLKCQKLNYMKTLDDATFTRIFHKLKEKKPYIKGFLFCNNGIERLSIFKNFAAYFPLLKSLILKNNRISHINQLTHIKDCNLEILSFEGNPIKNDSKYNLFVYIFILYMK